MTVDTDRQSEHLSRADQCLLGILTARKFTFRNTRHHLRNMITGVQPLVIDDNEICTDRILAELITFESVDRMIRETGTLSLKKATFCNFESSMTPVPKYCFSEKATHQTVLVHSVPRFTLGDILAWCEKQYPAHYAHSPFSYYHDWIKSFIARVSKVSFSKRTCLRQCLTLPRLIVPPPPRIHIKERRAFISLLLQPLMRHHLQGIFHDSINEKTIFFPTLTQPLFLSNYAGIPSETLIDYLPDSLLTEDALVRYGSQCRDVYAMALISYRILTGKEHDGRNFALDAPPPLAMVLNNVITNTGYLFSLKSIAAIHHTIVSGWYTISELLLKTLHLFSRDSFTTWHTLNRATGALWRSIPFLGKSVNLIFPTSCAHILRTLLDLNWFLRFYEEITTTDSLHMNSVDLEMLNRVITRKNRGMIPHFHAAFNTLTYESALRRQAFGSLMENEHTAKSSIKKSSRRLLLIGTLLTGIALFSAFILIRELRRTDEIIDDISTTSAFSSAHSPAAPASLPSGIKDSVYAPHTPVTTHSKKIPLRRIKKSAPPPVKTPVKSKTRRVKKTAPVIQQKPPTSAVTPEPDITPEPIKDSAVQPAAHATPSPANLLIQAGDYRNVYKVINVSGRINPASLRIAHRRSHDNSLLPVRHLLYDRMYFVPWNTHKYGSIISLRRCTLPECDTARYYISSGSNHSRTPVLVGNRDLISKSSYSLRRYLREHQ